MIGAKNTANPWVLSTRSHVVRQLILVFSGLLMLVLIVGLVSFYRIAGSLDHREVTTGGLRVVGPGSAGNQMEQAWGIAA